MSLNIINLVLKVSSYQADHDSVKIISQYFKFKRYLKFWGKVNGKSLFLATFGNFWQFLATFHMNFQNFQKRGCQKLPKIAMDTPQIKENQIIGMENGLKKSKNVTKIVVD